MRWVKVLVFVYLAIPAVLLIAGAYDIVFHSGGFPFCGHVFPCPWAYYWK